MLDLRPIGYVVGLLLATLGASMLAPMLLDIYLVNPGWGGFAQAAIITGLTGVLLAVACANAVREKLSLQQTFILTSGVWLVLPIFGALPLMLGEAQLGVTDAFFEAMSGLTTTGATVMTGLDMLPQGVNLWRGILQWFGGIGIIVVAMAFLPELRVGGMQIFRSEGFDAMGKVLPRAAQIATQISGIYLGLTLACIFAYAAVGLPPFAAIMHALTTMSTGGFSSHDASFGAFSGAAEYVAVLFMLLASLPFARYIQLLAGTARPVLRDPQIHAYLAIIAAIVVVLTLFRLDTGTAEPEQAFRETLFNVTSIISGTGYSSTDYQLWGSFAVVIFFFIGLIGGCAGSTACSVKVFRYQLLFATIKSQIRSIHAPSGIFQPRYQGRPISDDVLNSVMAFFVAFIVTLGMTAILLALTGLDFVTSVSGAAASLANIGPGLGEIIGPVGTYQPLDPVAKWILATAMFIGRLELLAVYAIVTVKFWRDA